MSRKEKIHKVDLEVIELNYDDMIRWVMKDLNELFLEDGVNDNIRQQLEVMWKNKLAKWDSLPKLQDRKNKVSSSQLAPIKNSSRKRVGKHIAKKRKITTRQMDGSTETSSSEECNSSEGEKDEVEHGTDSNPEDDPLNSDDDLSDDEDTSTTDNIIVCQFDKIIRRVNRWKMHLKNGIINLNGKEYVFSSLTGEANW